ncbi:hypothetical protein K3495_g16107, partial [Podosphaera aphanis]
DIEKANPSTKPSSNLDIDILEISAPTYNLIARHEENQAFTVSLSEIESELNDQKLLEINASGNCQAGADDLLERLPERHRTFHGVFSKQASDIFPPRRVYYHKIELDKSGELGYGPLYNQSIAELKAVKDYLIENLDKGWITPSQAPHSSPVLFVKKSNSSLGFCVDYRKLNNLTKKDRYPLPSVDETLARLNRAKIFTKLDIRQAFHRITMHVDSEELTTFRTRYGAYKYRVLPFRLTNGLATYQRYMNEILFEYLDVFCTVYLDDIIIYSESIDEHETHVKQELEQLRQAGLQANIKKSANSKFKKLSIWDLS